MSLPDPMTDLDSGRKHAFGGGLYLHVRSPVSRSWLAILTERGKRFEITIGAAAGPGKPGLSLDDARTKADELKALRDAGQLAESRKPQPEPEAEAPPKVRTFKVVADEWFDKKFNTAAPKTIRDAQSLIKRFAGDLMPMEMATITKKQVIAVLEPVYKSSHRNASDLQIKLKTIFGYAIAIDDHPGPNPASSEVLPHVLPTKGPAVEHHESVPWKDLPGVMRVTRTKNRPAARALEFATLCAVRPTECRGARVQEFDLADEEKPVWTVPAARMKVKFIKDKKGKEIPAPDHQVPLSRQAVALLRAVIPADAAPDALVFFETEGKMLGHNTMNHTLQRITDGTAHGMRSSFSTWREEATTFPERLAEAALAHVYKTESESAYNRSDLLEQRRPLMQAWADYLDS
jgi:integrase